DPISGETPEQAKKRYLEAIENFALKPTFIIDSGNGIQVLWRLKKPLGSKHLPWAEALSKTLMHQLGAKAGTQNIDRVLRVPGTIKWPKEAKGKRGSKPVLARLLQPDKGLSYDQNDFPPVEITGPGVPTDGGQHSKHIDLEDVIEHGRYELFLDEGGRPDKSR